MSSYQHSREAIAEKSRPQLQPVPVASNIRKLISTTFNLLDSRKYEIFPVNFAPKSTEESEKFHLAREAALHFRELNAKNEPRYRSRMLCAFSHHATVTEKSDLCLGVLTIPLSIHTPAIVAYQALRNDPSIAVPLYAGKKIGELYRSDKKTLTL